MKIVIAPNAFKDSLTAWEAARALEKGVRQALPHATLVLVPVADGGDGTAEALARATGGQMVHARVAGPLGRPVRAVFAVLGGGLGAVIEMAAASGLRLLAPRERNPMRTSTFGTGQLIRAAVRRGLRRLIIGIGGSATVDGGTGMAAALGYRFLDARGREVLPCGGNLKEIARIDAEAYLRWRKSLREPLELTVASDVTNPLLGPEGAARVFGPQKGATPTQVEQLETGLAHLAGVIRRDLGIRVASLRGSGAAGGLGAGLVAFCGAVIRSGARVVLDAVRLEEKLADADWVITGEGKLDGQTAFGKAPAVVARVAKRHRVRVIGVAGSLGPDARRLLRGDFDALFSLCDHPMDPAEAMRNARPLLEQLAESIGALLASDAGGNIRGEALRNESATKT